MTSTVLEVAVPCTRSETRASALLTRTVRDGDCLLWTGAVGSKGYGSVWVDGRSALVHRVAYETFVGPIPEGLTIDHVKARGCRSKLCIEPAHLEPVTIGENNRRTGHGSEPRCKRDHELTGSNLLLKKRGPGRSVVRNCRTCRDTAGAVA